MKKYLSNKKIKNQKAMGLIVTVIIMMALSMMAIAFARVMVFNRIAAGNYCSRVDAKLAAYAGLDRAIAVLRQETLEHGHIRWIRKPNHGVSGENNYGRRTTYGRTNYNCWQIKYPAPPNGDSNNSDLKYPSDYPEVAKRNATHDGTENDLQKASSNQRLLSLFEGVNGNYSYSGSLGLQKNSTSGKYTNGTNRYDIYGRYEKDGTTYALKIENSNGRFNVNSHIADDPTKQASSNTIVQRILRSLIRRCGLSTDSSAIDFWARKIRPDTYSPANPIKWEDLEKEINSWSTTDESKEKLLGNLTTDAWMSNSTVASAKTVAADVLEPGLNNDLASHYYREKRSPIDVNSASIELIASLIENIKGNVVFYNLSGMAGSGNYATEEIGESVHIGKFSVQAQKSISISPTNYDIDFSDTGKATTIAQQIINSRPYTYRRQLENIIEGMTGNFPSAPSGISSANWNTACRDALKSNFNPNATENYFNPNFYNYRRVSKALLFEAGTPGTPHHTSELCFYNHGNIKITSLGQITAEQGTKIIGSMSITAEIRLSEIMRQTTQAEFMSNGNVGTETVSFPVAQPNVEDYASFYTGGIEPKASGVSGGFVPNLTTSTSVPKNRTVIGTKMNFAGALQRNHNLVHDGVVSRAIQYSGLANTQYYSEKAIGTTSDFRNTNFYRVGNYQGTISFWVKPEEDVGVSTGVSDPELPMGIMSIVTKSENTKNCNSFPDFHTQDRHEGVQMVVYKNSLGLLRVSRMYYTICYSDTYGGWYGSVFEGDADPKRLYPRHDVTIDLTKSGLNWKAHTWNHIQISWNDETGQLRLWVNGNSGDVVSQTVDDPNFHPEFCVLNEKDPEDCFFINGFARRQVLPKGYFHFGSDIHFPGCATIAGVASSGSYTSTSVKPSKYPASAVFNGVFRVGCIFSMPVALEAQLPPGTVGVPLRSQFAKYGYKLPNDNAQITVASSGTGKWILKDKVAEVEYVIVKETIKSVQKLNVYRGDLYNNDYDFVIGPMRWTGYPAKADVSNVNVICSSSDYGSTNGDSNNGGGLFPANTIVKSIGDDISYTATFSSANDTCASLDSVTIVLIYSYPRIRSMQFNY